MRFRIIIPLLLSIYFSVFLWKANAQSAQETETRLKKIIQTIDDLYRSNTSYAELEMSIVTPDWERTLKLNVWTEGKDKTFIRILEPKKERGMGTLRIKNEMWNYLPKTNKVIKIPPSMMMSSWMGSDFNNDDLVNEFSLLQDYTYRFVTPDQAAPGLLQIECAPKEGLPIIWSRVLMTVREQDYLPVKEEYYDEKGQLMRTINYRDIRSFGSRTIPAVLELIPEHKKGNRTILTYNQVKFDIELDRNIFSERNLRRVD